MKYSPTGQRNVHTYNYNPAKSDHVRALTYDRNLGHVYATGSESELGAEIANVLFTVRQ